MTTFQIGGMAVGQPGHTVFEVFTGGVWRRGGLRSVGWPEGRETVALDGGLTFDEDDVREGRVRPQEQRMETLERGMAT